MLKLQVIGYIGKDAVINTVNNNTVINFTVAHTDKYKDNNGNPVEKTTWVSCAYWTQNTAIAQYLKKGKQIYAEGSPETDFYNKTNSIDGLTAFQKLRVRSIQLLGSAPQQNQAGAGVSQPRSNTGGRNTSDMYTDASEITEPIQDLPF